MSFARVILLVYWRKSRLAFAGTIAGFVAACLLLLVGDALGIHPDYIEVGKFAVMTVALGVVAFTIVMIHADSDRLHYAMPKRVFRLPAASWKIVALQVSYGALASAAVGLVLGLLAVALVGMDIAWWGPACVAVFVVCGLQAWANMQSEDNPRAAVLSLLICSIVVLLLLTLPGLGSFVGRITPFVAAAISIGVFYGVALFGLVINRHGGFSEFPSLTFWQGGKRFAKGPLPRRFNSARAAQRWYEWRKYGWQLPTSVLLVLAIFFLLMPVIAVVFEGEMSEKLAQPDNPSRAENIDWLTSVQFVLTGMQVSAVVSAVVVGGLMFMNAGYWGATSTFLNTRPMSTRRMAASRLSAALLSTSLGLAFFMVFFTIIVVVTSRMGEPIGMVHFLRQGYEQSPDWAIVAFYWAVLFTIMWSAVWAANVGWAFFVFGVTVAVPSTIASTLRTPSDSIFVDTTETSYVIVQYCTWAGAAILAAGFLYAFYQALRQGLVSKPFLAAAAIYFVGFWIVLVAFHRAYIPDPTANIIGDERFPHPIDWVLWAGLSLIPIAPVFTHPWLLERARHR